MKIMKIKTLIYVIAATGFAFNMQAQKAQESFEYPVGELNVTEGDEATGWSTGWVARTPEEASATSITSESIVYNGIAKGKALTFSGALTEGGGGVIIRNFEEGAFPDEAGKTYWFGGLRNLLSDTWPKEHWGGFTLHTNTDQSLYMGMEYTK
jgi:hypothetical protein